MGIIILSIAILPILGVGGMQLFKAEIPSPVKDKITPRIAETAKNLWLVYVVITAAEVVLLFLGGMSAFDAVCHSFATMATGGFGTYDASIGHFNSLYIEIVIICFMFVAGMNFTLHYRLIRGDSKTFFRDPEFHFYAAIVLVSTAIITLDLRFHYFSNLGESLRYAAFQVVSIMTTTGFATYNFDQWPAPSKFILILLMFIGGCAGSTGGAIKCLRFLIVIKQTFIELSRLIHPHAVLSVKLAKSRRPAGDRFQHPELFRPLHRHRRGGHADAHPAWCGHGHVDLGRCGHPGQCRPRPGARQRLFDLRRAPPGGQVAPVDLHAPGTTRDLHGPRPSRA